MNAISIRLELVHIYKERCVGMFIYIYIYV